VRAPLKAMLGFIEKMVKAPEQLAASDAAAVRAAGVTDEGLRTAIDVCAAFSLITRIADTFDFHVPPKEAHRASAQVLLKRGYIL
jgi:alkylhydroperoxidase family enzyme